MVIEYLKNNSNAYTIDELLFLDDTNKDLQTIYANKNVEKLNNEKVDAKRKIYIEKTQKAKIIIEENNYNKIIEKIINKEIMAQLKYINFKSTLKNSLQCIIDNENSINKAKKQLMLRKRFNFNKWPEICENNFYLYKINLRLFDKLNDIFFIIDIIKILLRK